MVVAIKKKQNKLIARSPKISISMKDLKNYILLYEMILNKLESERAREIRAYRDEELMKILKRIEILEEKIEKLEDRLDKIENLTEGIDSSSGDLVSLDEIKKMILEYINSQEGILYPSDIAEKLNLDYMDVIKALEELVREGKIDVAEEE